MKKLTIGIIILLGILVWYFFFNCPKFPTEIGKSVPGQIFFETDYVEMTEDKKYVVYQVKYHAHNLTAKAKLEYKRKNLLLHELLFEKWLLTFEYEKENCKKFEIPSKINVYCGKRKTEEYSLNNLITKDMPEQFIPSKNIGKQIPESVYFQFANEAEYTSKSGEKVLFDVGFFDVSNRTD